MSVLLTKVLVKAGIVLAVILIGAAANHRAVMRYPRWRRTVRWLTRERRLFRRRGRPG